MNAQDINQRYDLLTLAGHHTTLKKAAAKEWAGPCPFCNDGKDRFHVKQFPNGYRWFCSHCLDGRNFKGSPIDFVMRLHGLEFKAAAAKMAAELGGDLEALPRLARPAPAPVLNLDPHSPEWAREAWQYVDEAIDKLFNPEGKPALDYLTKRRALEMTTIKRAKLGYDPALYGRPAIILPYFDEERETYTIHYTLTGVKARYFDDLAAQDKGQRYRSPKFGKDENEKNRFYFYGMFGLCAQADTLCLVEGDFNRLSISQLEPKRTHILSPGSESITPEQTALFKILARKYDRLFIWMDDPNKAKAWQVIAERADAVVIHTEIIDGVKLDANQLAQSHALADVLITFGFEIRQAHP